MWVRLRLDIGWSDLARGFFGSLAAGDVDVAQQKLESFWSAGNSDALACLSVRSGFDLLLQALDLPAGTEVLFSAVTLGDMPQIARAHGLTPRPVDVFGSDFHLDADSLERAIGPRTRVLVAAYLFGARPDMGGVLEIARRRKLFVVEDCAQAWWDVSWRGNQQADASLFSFGTIKTATALGGALCRVRDASVLARMRDIQQRQPVQSGAHFPVKCGKSALLKLISARPAFGLLAAAGRRFGKSVDEVLGGMTQGFSESGLLDQLRRRPSAATLALLLHRLKTYEPQRVARRIANARRIVANLQLEKTQSELLDGAHSFWLFPLLTGHAERLVAFLQSHGFDTARRGRMEITPAPADRPELMCPSAEDLLRRTVFLPCYPEMPGSAIDRMCDLVRRFEAEQTRMSTASMVAAGG